MMIKYKIQERKILGQPLGLNLLYHFNDFSISSYYNNNFLYNSTRYKEFNKIGISIKKK
jgi:hypothetical protein